MGSELVLTFADGMADLARAAVDLAQTRAAESPGTPGVVLVRLPLVWLSKATDAGALFGRVLLFTTPDPRDLLETYALVKRVVSLSPVASIGITVHGVRSVGEARRAFLRLAAVSERHLFRALVSYGLIVDDLQVYRSIVNRHAVGLTHPRAAASRAIGEVAQLLLGDLAGKAPGA
jgi:MinD-like ATPase involved in chromosome partitioning or flagellar assembly